MEIKKPNTPIDRRVKRLQLPGGKGAGEHDDSAKQQHRYRYSVYSHRVGYVKRCIPYRIGTEQHLGCSSCLALAQIKERQHNTQDQQRRTSRYHHSADGLNAFGKV